MRKLHISVISLFLLFCSSAKAQKTNKVVNLPEEISIGEYKDTWMYTNKGVLSYKGEWILENEEMELIAEIGGTFFIRKRITSADEYGSERTLSSAIFRYDRTGKIMDSLVIDGLPNLSRYLSGIAVNTDYGDEYFTFIPARGEPLKLSKSDHAQELLTGLNNDITVWIKPVSDDAVIFDRKSSEELEKLNSNYYTVAAVSDSVLNTLRNEKGRIRTKLKSHQRANRPDTLLIKLLGKDEFVEVYEDKNYKKCFLLSSTITGLKEDRYLCLKGAFEDKRGSVLKEAIPDPAYSTYNKMAYFTISPKKLKYFLDKDYNKENYDKLLRDVFYLNDDLEIIKFKGQIAVYINENMLVCRDKKKQFNVILANYGKLCDESHPIQSFNDISNYGFNILYSDKKYKLFSSGKLVAEFSELKMPYSSKYQKNNERTIFIGKDLSGKIAVFHEVGQFFEDTPSEWLIKWYDEIPKYTRGLFSTSKESQYSLKILTGFSEDNPALIGYIGGWDSNDSIFNPAHLDVDSVRIKLEENKDDLFRIVKVMGVTADGDYISKVVTLPSGYYLTKNFNQGTHLPGILNLGDGNYEFFIPCDSIFAKDALTKKLYLVSSDAKNIYPFENSGLLIHLFQSYTYIRTHKFPKEFRDKFYYVFENNTPRLLKSVYGDVLSAESFEDLVILNHLGAGFMDRKGVIQVFVNCKEGSCENKKLQFKSGVAATSSLSLTTGKESYNSINFIGKDGRKAFDKQFYCVSDFHDGVAYGTLLDSTADILSHYNYAMTEITYGGVKAAKFSLGDIYFPKLFNTRGEIITEIENCTHFKNGKFFHNTYKEDTLGFGIFDSTNILLRFIPGYSVCCDKFGYAHPVKGDYFRAVENKTAHVAFFDFYGNLILKTDLKYSDSFILNSDYWVCDEFSCGWSLVDIRDWEKSKTYFINIAGNELLKDARLRYAHPFSENRAFVKDSIEWYIVDTSGKRWGNEKFEYVADFRNGLARVKYNGNLYGFIDTLGRPINSVKYKTASDFSEGFSFVNDQLGYSYFIDISGTKVNFPFDFVSASEFSEGLCYVTTEATQSVIDKNGLVRNFKIPRRNRSEIDKYLNDGYTENYSGLFYTVLSKKDANYHIKKILVTHTE